VLGDGEGREGDAGAGARGLVHLAVDERGLRDDGRADSSFDSLISRKRSLPSRVRSPTPANTLTPPCLRDVVDELHDEHGLADAGAAEEADLAALSVGGEQVDHLDARLEDLDLGRLLLKLGRVAVNGHVLAGVHGARLVDWLADDVEDAAEAGVADGHHDGLAGVGDFHAAAQAVGRLHGDGAHGRLAEVLGDLEHDHALVLRDAQRVEDLGEPPRGELDVDDGPDDLRDLPDRKLIRHGSLHRDRLARARGRGPSRRAASRAALGRLERRASTTTLRA
jgi:hypothetical protein